MTDFKRPLRVFLCHASSDKPIVRNLYERLAKDGIDAWLDKEKLIPGQNWQIEIPKAVKNSDVVIVCLSSQSVTKEGFVQKEIKFALDSADEKPAGTIFIIPARLENCDVPDRISQFQWVDLFSDDGYEWLLKALQIRAESVGAIIALEKSKVAERSLSKVDSPPQDLSKKKDLETVEVISPPKKVISPKKTPSEKLTERKKEQPKAFVPIEAKCIYFTTEYRESFKGKYVWMYEKKGLLRLTEESLIFRSNDFSFDINLESVRSIEAKTYPRIAKPIRLAYIVINYIENRQMKSIGLMPSGTTQEKNALSVWGINRVIENWFEFFDRIPKLSSKVKKPLGIPSQTESRNEAIFYFSILIGVLALSLFIISIVFR
jgi:hypothetical protein